MAIKVLVCGDRHWTNRQLIFDTLDKLDAQHGIHGIIEGGSTGADAFAKEWAEKRLKFLLHMPADWNAYGKGAGPKRNAAMLVYGKPDFVLGFHDYMEKSRGTRDMLNKAVDARVPAFHYTQFSGGVGLAWAEKY